MELGVETGDERKGMRLEAWSRLEHWAHNAVVPLTTLVVSVIGSSCELYSKKCH